MRAGLGKYWLVMMIFLVAFGVIIALMLGHKVLDAGTVLTSLYQGIFGLCAGTGVPHSSTDSVIWFIRLPRILAALLVGAALAISGAVMQGIFSNPLAEPGLLGLSSGASVGAICAIYLGLTSQSMYAMPAFAFGGAIVALLIVVILAMKNGRIPVMVLLLSGVAVNFFCSALTSGLLMVMNEYRVREYLFWVVGGLDYRRWEHIFMAITPVVLGAILLIFLARQLNLLALGEDEARGVGLPVMKYRILLLGVAALTTASAVCISGSIGFVGLVVPHMMRFLVGSDHRVLLPASALAGGLFLLACDTLGRSILPFTEIRVGIVTALVGVPYFLYLLRRERGRS